MAGKTAPSAGAEYRRNREISETSAQSDMRFRIRFQNRGPGYRPLGDIGILLYDIAGGSAPTSRRAYIFGASKWYAEFHLTTLSDARRYLPKYDW